MAESPPKTDVPYVHIMALGGEVSHVISSTPIVANVVYADAHGDKTEKDLIATEIYEPLDVIVVPDVVERHKAVMDALHDLIVNDPEVD